MTRPATLRRAIAGGAVAALGLSVLTAAPASAAGSIAECLSANAGITDIVCHEVTKLPGSPSVGQVQVSWQLVPGNLDTLEGGLWMSRSPIKGQRTGSRTEYPNANSRANCSNGNPAGFQDCAKTYSGASGSFVLDFPVSMAGYQYILTASETLRNAAGETGGADLNDNTPNTVVWVYKANRYTVKGKTVVTLKCPANKRKECKPAVLLQLNSDVGNGMPVSPVN